MRDEINIIGLDGQWVARAEVTILDGEPEAVTGIGDNPEVALHNLYLNLGRVMIERAVARRKIG